MKYRSRQTVEAFRWTPGCELPEWCEQTRIVHNSTYNLYFLGLLTRILNPKDFIINDNGRIFRLSPADFAERYEAVK